ncbi:hypothetical protein [Paenibacillus antarcticus]|uniref:Transglycosylase n=1 Tax=Paenibacillus antarcticus TaxID=253703 RepID=A0A168R1Q1_9BACL|nr:hypothetical protein [Paenibacillus antarcticus]OAB48473.1 hypothetical protein PBAT_02240 [Paenibacillus antarcticus]
MSNPQTTTCDAGCNQQFTVDQFTTERIGNGVDKIYFACTHCNHKYAAFYSDIGVRRLQAKIRRVQQKFANPHADHAKAARQETEIQQQIKERMDALRLKVEGEGGLNG